MSWCGRILRRILREPALITHALARAHGGAWLPQALQARRKTLRDALTQIERQQARLLEVYLAEIIGRDEFERKRQVTERTRNAFRANVPRERSFRVQGTLRPW